MVSPLHPTPQLLAKASTEHKRLGGHTGKRQEMSLKGYRECKKDILYYDNKAIRQNKRDNRGIKTRQK